jgi:hypothetical protein
MRTILHVDLCMELQKEKKKFSHTIKIAKLTIAADIILRHTKKITKDFLFANYSLRLIFHCVAFLINWARSSEKKKKYNFLHALRITCCLSLRALKCLFILKCVHEYAHAPRYRLVTLYMVQIYYDWVRMLLTKTARTEIKIFKHFLAKLWKLEIFCDEEHIHVCTHIFLTFPI